MAMLDLAKSMTSFLLGLTKADVADAERRAGDQARMLTEAIEAAVSAGESLLADLPESQRAIDDVLRSEARTNEAVCVYRGTANIARDKVAIFDAAQNIHQQLDEIVSLARDVGVASAELIAVYQAHGDLVRRAMVARPALLDLAEELEDIVASIESDDEQGNEPLIPHDEIMRRHGLDTQ